MLLMFSPSNTVTVAFAVIRIVRFQWFCLFVLCILHRAFICNQLLSMLTGVHQCNRSSIFGIRRSMNRQAIMYAEPDFRNNNIYCFNVKQINYSPSTSYCNCAKG